MIKLVTDNEEANNLLQLYKGADLQIVMYNRSLKRIAIRLSLSSTNKIIYVVGVGCERINGFFSFSNAGLSITSDVNKVTGENRTRVIDEKSGFELITTGGFSLAQGLESDFGESFDDFLKDKSKLGNSID